ncbi:Cullin-domain-containing protein [Pseudovirgaria hyperparasitica]|uniref:Cullin-domain-containing protein n=1 Tax=Pseudovirgaria hyperparasitica TaxID=470096 RepID=A0A6A6VV95_9PEZI|nr:Cullin-domain-containing protein [Pseudovirgaria hyperparasitica]KAF2753644.1 Cullin-domain-containing protein [Pseudovirgaria hyperparasitica]
MSLTSNRTKHRVKPPRKGLQGDAGGFEQMWPELRDAFGEVHKKCASKLSYEQLYRKGYTLVLKKMGIQLYDGIKESESVWLKAEVLGEIRAVLAAGQFQTSSGRSENEQRIYGEEFLRIMKNTYNDYMTSMSMIADVLMYLDRVFCKDHRCPTVFSMAMGLFRKIVLEESAYPNDPVNVLRHLTDIILFQIQLERSGEIIDKSLIRQCVYMLEGLYVTDQEREEDRLYVNAFEPHFLDTSREFYKSEAERMLFESDAGAYCRIVRKRINEEQDRCRSTLSDLTTEKIVRVVENELIKNQIGNIIASPSGVRHMIDNDLFDELELIYELESRIDKRKGELKKALQKKIVEAGMEVNNAAIAASQASAAPAQAGEGGESSSRAPAEKSGSNQTVAALTWVDDVLKLKDKYDLIWQRSFDQDQDLQTALTRSFSDFINSATFPRGSEYISLFIDENMKKGIKGKSEAEIDQLLDKAITLLRYVLDKDMFERYYKKHLCRRLLMNKSVSNDVEKQMISRMKIELGNSFTVKLEAMFKDMTISEELTSGYKNFIHNMGATDPTRVDLSISVLTSMTWPLESMGGAIENSDSGGRSKCKFPPTIERVRQNFERFYSEKHSGRQLTWLSNMGTADIKAIFPKVQTKEGYKERKHELNVSTYAMVVLLLFNDLPADQRLSFETIHAETNIPKADLVRTLQSLAVSPKTRILVKEPMSRDVKPTDHFCFNEGFKSPFVKVKVGVVMAGNKVENERERRETEQKNEASRGFVIEAAIVRIMKQRKELSHQQLIAEVLSQMAAQFKPEVAMIKKRVESLIEREYLERLDGQDLPAYRYLA